MDAETALIWTKFGALVILFTITLTCGSVPFCLFKSRHNNARIPSRVFSILNCFAGGIFFGLCLLDLLPDVIESFENSLGEDPKFPFAELSVTCGLLLVLVVEQIGHAVQAKLGSKRKGNERASLSPNSTLNRNFGTFNGPSSGQTESDTQTLAAGEEPEYPSSSHTRDNAPHDRSTVEDDQEPVQGNVVITAHTNNHIDDCHVMHSPSAFRSLLLLGALSFHSILEGIAVGILPSTTEVWTLLVAIAIHKSVISFSLGINFLTTMRKFNAILCQIIFAIMSPLGIAIGMVIVSQIDEFSSSIWEAILQGGATGTFLYVTFFELLPHEIEAPRDKILKVLAILVGFGVIAGLITYEVNHE